MLKSARVEGSNDRLRRRPRRTRAGRRAHHPRLEHSAACGHHNALNALAAIAAASEAGIADDAIRKAIAGFSGVKRRFQLTGTWNGVVDLRRLWPPPGGDRRGAEGRPRRRARPRHRRGRAASLHARARPVRDFAACFKDADKVIVTPLYSAGELPIDGVDHASLAEGDPHHRSSHRVATVDSERDVVPMLRRSALDRRHGRLPGRRQQHRMGARAARLAGGTSRVRAGGAA